MKLGECMHAELLKMGVEEERVNRVYTQHVQAVDAMVMTEISRKSFCSFLILITLHATTSVSC